MVRVDARFWFDLTAAGLPAAAMDSAEHHPLLRASHEAGAGLVGPDVGTPITAVDRPDGRRVAWVCRAPAGRTPAGRCPGAATGSDHHHPGTSHLRTPTDLRHYDRRRATT